MVYLRSMKEPKHVESNKTDFSWYDKCEGLESPECDCHRYINTWILKYEFQKSTT